MKLTSPENKSTGLDKLEEALIKFEAKLELEPIDKRSYYLRIDGEYNLEVCREIEKMYRKEGWCVNCDITDHNSTILSLKRIC